MAEEKKSGRVLAAEASFRGKNTPRGCLRSRGRAKHKGHKAFDAHQHGTGKNRVQYQQVKLQQDQAYGDTVKTINAIGIIARSIAADSKRKMINTKRYVLGSRPKDVKTAFEYRKFAQNVTHKRRIELKNNGLARIRLCSDMKEDYEFYRTTAQIATDKIYILYYKVQRASAEYKAWSERLHQKLCDGTANFDDIESASGNIYHRRNIADATSFFEHTLFSIVAFNEEIDRITKHLAKVFQAVVKFYPEQQEVDIQIKNQRMEITRICYNPRQLYDTETIIKLIDA